MTGRTRANQPTEYGYTIPKPMTELRRRLESLFPGMDLFAEEDETDASLVGMVETLRMSYSDGQTPHLVGDDLRRFLVAQARALNVVIRTIRDSATGPQRDKMNNSTYAALMESQFKELHNIARTYEAALVELQSKVHVLTAWARRAEEIGRRMEDQVVHLSKQMWNVLRDALLGRTAPKKEKNEILQNFRNMMRNVPQEASTVEEQLEATLILKDGVTPEQLHAAFKKMDDYR